MPEDGVCPECGTNISFTNLFGRLDHADPLFVSMCVTGVTLLVITAITHVIYSGLYYYYAYFPQFEFSATAHLIYSGVRGVHFLEPIALGFLLVPEFCARQRLERTNKSRLIHVLAIACAVRFVPTSGGVWSVAPLQIIFGLMAVLVHALIYLRLRDLAARSDARLITDALVVMIVNIVAIGFITLIPSVLSLAGVSAPQRQMPLLLRIISGPIVAGFSAMMWWKFRRMTITAAERARDNWPGRTNGSRETDTAALT